MRKEFFVGRSGQSAIKIPDSKTTVSLKHAKITINEKGEWWVEDWRSTNGTYIRDEAGKFIKVNKKRITEDTVIRLGLDGRSVTFMAYRVLDPTRYIKEFDQLKELYKDWNAKKTRSERRKAMEGWIVRFSGLAVLGILYLVGINNHWRVDPNVRYFIIASTPAVMGCLFQSRSKEANRLKKERQEMFVCPHCSHVLSDEEILGGYCGHCHKD